MNSIKQVKEIIEGGYCIGCGACAAASSGQVKIVEDEYGQYQAQIKPDADDTSLESALEVCPFSNEGLNEDQISEKVFDQEKGRVGDVIGYYQSLYAGHVVDDEVREKVTSGGIITWTCRQLLQRGMVDAVIHIKKSGKKGTLFEYGISRTP